MRWWDGRQWTSHSQPAQQASPQPAPPAGSNGESGETPKRAKIGLFGARKAARDLEEENAQLRKVLADTGALELAELRLEASNALSELSGLTRAVSDAKRELNQLNQQLLDVRHGINVQEFGLYNFKNPAEDSAQLAGQLSALRLEIRRCITDKEATQATSNFTFNNSASQGKRFVNDMSKMLLAAYNAEAENAIKTVKAGGLSTATARLERAAERVAKNGKMIDLRISSRYHSLRIHELQLAAQHLAAVQAAKEAERARREELREAKRAEDELRRERQKLDKEREHYANALDALVARGDEAGAQDMRMKLEEIDRAISDVDYRAANVRAGYVYVISNLGSMGENVVKIGMTRRLDPMDRIRELSDASVPFNFDVHALFFSEDAYGIEAMLHREFAGQRVNRVNMRREFFYATPGEVLEALRDHDVAVVEYQTEASAEEFRVSRELTKSETAPQ